MLKVLSLIKILLETVSGMAICCRVKFFFFSCRRRHTRWPRDWSSDVCSSDLRLSAPFHPGRRGHPGLVGPDRLAETGKINGKAAARSQRARHVDGAAEAGYDAVHQGQTESGPNADLLGREERIEDPLPDLGGDTRSAVGHLQYDILGGQQRAHRGR